VIPLAVKHLSLMLLENPDWLVIQEIPQQQRAISLSRKNLILVALIEADIITSILCLPLPNQLHLSFVNLD
jgi:hypothetical protein